MNSSKSIKFLYLYRDASNYKAWGEVTFRSREELCLEEIDQRLKNAFDTDGIFNAGQVQIPEVFLYKDGKITNRDHCFHEYYSVELSNEHPTDLQNRSMKEFLEGVEQESRRGWKAFDPLDWLAQAKTIDL